MQGWGYTEEGLTICQGSFEILEGTGDLGFSTEKQSAHTWIFDCLENELKQTGAGGMCYNGPDARGPGHALEIGSGDGKTKSEKVLEEHHADSAEKSFRKGIV